MPGINDLYGNSYYDRAKRLNAVRSSRGGGGLAAPFLALAAGRASRRGSELDARQKGAQAGVKMVMDMVKSGNSLGATKILNGLVSRYPQMLSNWKGIEFNAPITKDGVVTINGKLVVLAGLKEMSKPGVTPEQRDKLMARYVFDIGGKKGTSPYSKIDQSKLTPESRVAFDKSRNVKDLNYSPKSAGSSSSGFNSVLGLLNGLQKQKANLFGNPISQDQVKQSLDVLDPQIQNIERYLRTKYPDDAKSYFPAPDNQGPPPVAPPGPGITHQNLQGGGAPQIKQEDSKSLIGRLVKGIKSLQGGGADTSAAPVYANDANDPPGTGQNSGVGISTFSSETTRYPTTGQPTAPAGVAPAPQGAGLNQFYTPTDTYKPVNIPTPGNNPAYDKAIRGIFAEAGNDPVRAREIAKQKGIPY